MRAIWILALCCLAVLMVHAKKVRVAVILVIGMNERLTVFRMDLMFDCVFCISTKKLRFSTAILK